MAKFPLTSEKPRIGCLCIELFFQLKASKTNWKQRGQLT